jgi:VCBS repeat-containing protein
MPEELHTYAAIYGCSRIEVQGKSLYDAKKAAVRILKVRPSKEHMMSVMLVKKADGTEITHTGAELP